MAIAVRVLGTGGDGAPPPLAPLRRGSREGPRVGIPGPPRDGCEEEVSLAQDLPPDAGRCEEVATGRA
jgi:hypothetical protein